jgi:H+/gluconate symporter-like permease
LCGGIFIFTLGVLYLQWQKRKAARRKEGYGTNHTNEPEVFETDKLPSVYISFVPLILVMVSNKFITTLIQKRYEKSIDFSSFGFDGVPPADFSPFIAVWGACCALIIGIITILLFRFRQVKSNIKNEFNVAIGGALFAVVNTASEYGFGAVIASLPGFKAVREGLASAFGNPLVNEAATVTMLSGITGSASGGLSIALATMKDTFVAQALQHGIPNEVLHRVASMASGGMDTLPHNGSILTVLIISGLTHRQSYKDIFVITIFKWLRHSL